MVGKRVEGNLGGGVLGLAESRAVLRALEDPAVEVDGGLEPRRVVQTFSNARVRRQIEAAPLRQLLKLVLVHFFYLPILSSLSLSTTTLSPIPQAKLYRKVSFSRTRNSSISDRIIGGESALLGSEPGEKVSAASSPVPGRRKWWSPTEIKRF